MGVKVALCLIALASPATAFVSSAAALRLARTVRATAPVAKAPAANADSPLRGCAVVVGGILAHTILGTMYYTTARTQDCSSALLPCVPPRPTRSPHPGPGPRRRRYCFPNFLSYAPSSLLFFDGLVHPGVTPDAVQVMPLGLVALNLGMPVGARCNKKFGPRVTTFMGCAAMVTGTYVASYQSEA